MGRIGNRGRHCGQGLPPSIQEQGTHARRGLDLPRSREPESGVGDGAGPVALRLDFGVAISHARLEKKNREGKPDMATSTKDKSKAKRRLRSREWFDAPGDPTMAALYLERYMNFGLTLAELHSGRPIIGIAQTGRD